MARRVLVASVMAVLATVVLGMAPASADPVADESSFVAHINALRASKGLPTLQVHSELTSVARSWAAHMAAQGSISHNPNLAGEVRADWIKLGENVGMGPGVDALHQAFVNSPAHYRNLVDPDFRYVGIGVVIDAQGTMFVAEEFMQLATAPAAAPAPAPTTTAPAPTTTAAPAPRPTVARPAATPVAVRAAATPAPSPAPEPAPAPAPEPVAPARIGVVLEQLAALDALS